MLIPQNFSPNVRKYGKLCKDGHIISSKWITKDKIKNRNNYSVAVNKIIFLNIILLQKYTNSFLYQINITVDKYAYFPNVSPELVEKEIFGEIEYFIMHKHNGLECIFAYVRKIDKYEEDNLIWTDIF